MSLAGLFTKTLGATLQAVAKYHRAKRTGSLELQEVAIPEKAINLLLEAQTERSGPIQKPHVAFHDGFFEFKCFILPDRLHAPDAKPKRSAKKAPVFCVMPLHFSSLAFSSHSTEAVVTRAGKIQLVSGSFREMMSNTFWGFYLNSTYGEKKLLTAVASEMAHVQFMPSFTLCGNEVRPSQLRLDLMKLLASQSLSAALFAGGISHIVGIHSLKEEEGQVVLTLVLGSSYSASRDSSDIFQLLP